MARRATGRARPSHSTEGPSKAVRTTFVNLYEKGLIYRGERIANWCPRCATALSDLEVKHEDKAASLYHIRYDLSDGSGALTIATTRPETLLGDTAVAVNPDDERYSEYVGKSAVLPVLGRIIPIIADSAVDPSFGTGALKVTPGHDHNDFDIRERHDIELISAMNLDGTMNEKAGPYEGVDRHEARTRIVAQLEREGLLQKIEPMHHSLGHCDRCNEVVEPLVSNQWYMKMEPLAKPAIEAVEDGRVGMVPERFSKVYFNWMYNIRDWCISRQLWWGHRIPAWYCDACDHTTVALEDPDACSGCGSMRIERDPDVLDTWFSSALWPHSTLGWPDRTEDLDYFYPSTVMETGHDILFFWVARMMMMGMENAGDIPFRTVYLHGLVRDPEGAKMSKSKGNVKDPLDLIDAYGADALRFALTTGTSPGNDMRLTDAKITSSRNFANKLWNASRFVVANLERSGVRPSWERPDTSHVEDRWIVSRLNRVAAQVDSCMNEFQFGEAQREVHDFLWGEYCDWYLEMSKVRMRAGDDSPIPVLAYVLERVLQAPAPLPPLHHRGDLAEPRPVHGRGRQQSGAHGRRIPRRRGGRLRRIGRGRDRRCDRGRPGDPKSAGRVQDSALSARPCRGPGLCHVRRAANGGGGDQDPRPGRPACPERGRGRRGLERQHIARALQRHGGRPAGRPGRPGPREGEAGRGARRRRSQPCPPVQASRRRTIPVQGAGRGSGQRAGAASCVSAAARPDRGDPGQTGWVPSPLMGNDWACHELV